MKLRILATILSLALAGTVQAKAVNLDLQGASISEVVQLIYSEATTTPYVLAPDVLEDERLVSFRYKDNQGKFSLFMQYFLDSLGYMVERKSGVDFVRKRVEGEPPIQAEHIYIYQPQYREVSYLSRTLTPLFKGSFVTNRSVRATPEASPKGDVPISSAASLIDQSSDVLVFAGAEEEIERLRVLLPQVDKRIGEVAVRGLVYEVSNTDRQGSAFGLLANLLGGHVGIGIGSTSTNLGNFIQIKNTSLDAVYSMLSSDSRFKVVSSPALRIQSGSQGVFSVGQDVPVLGALSYPQGAGQAVQSVEYRSSGVIFDIRPIVKEGIIDLDITQQLSNFVKTTTGVNNSPTLTKRELKTKVGMQNGDVIVLGGLTESKDTNTRDGLSFLPRFLHTTGYEQSSSEILLVLQVQRVSDES